MVSQFLYLILIFDNIRVRLIGIVFLCEADLLELDRLGVALRSTKV